MSISVTNSLSLRLYYGNYSKLVTGTTRSEATTGTLSFADASALRSAIKKLGEYNFEDASEDEVQEKLTAFADAMNNTLTSATKYGTNNTAVKNAATKIKQLNSDYASDLQKIGITVNKDGTMSVYENAAENYSRSRFTKFFTNDSEYLNELYTAAKKITRHVDLYI